MLISVWYIAFTLVLLTYAGGLMCAVCETVESDEVRRRADVGVPDDT
jgi:hypothetical protein